MNIQQSSPPAQSQNFQPPPLHIVATQSPLPTLRHARKLPANYLDRLPRPPEPCSPDFDAWTVGAMLTLALHHVPTFSHGDRVGEVLKNIFEIEEEHGLKSDYQLETLMLRFGADASTLMRAALAVSTAFGGSGDWLAPPFYRARDGSPALHLPSRSIICPVRRGGIVRALLSYENALDEAPRWISASFAGGAKVKPSIHVCNAAQARFTDTCVVVSHALEAEGLALHGAVTYVARNGLTPSAFVSQLLAELPRLRSVVLDLPLFDTQLVRALRIAQLEVNIYEL